MLPAFSPCFDIFHAALLFALMLRFRRQRIRFMPCCRFSLPFFFRHAAFSLTMLAIRHADAAAAAIILPCFLRHFAICRHMLLCHAADSAVAADYAAYYAIAAYFRQMLPLFAADYELISSFFDTPIIFAALPLRCRRHFLSSIYAISPLIRHYFFLRC